jgi:hypothetical protein
LLHLLQRLWWHCCLRLRPLTHLRFALLGLLREPHRVWRWSWLLLVRARMARR